MRQKLKKTLTANQLCCAAYLFVGDGPDAEAGIGRCGDDAVAFRENNHRFELIAEKETDEMQVNCIHERYLYLGAVADQRVDAGLRVHVPKLDEIVLHGHKQRRQNWLNSNEKSFRRSNLGARHQQMAVLQQYTINNRPLVAAEAVQAWTPKGENDDKSHTAEELELFAQRTGLVGHIPDNDICVATARYENGAGGRVAEAGHGCAVAAGTGRKTQESEIQVM